MCDDAAVAMSDGVIGMMFWNGPEGGNGRRGESKDPVELSDRDCKAKLPERLPYSSKSTAWRRESAPSTLLHRVLLLHPTTSRKLCLLENTMPVSQPVVASLDALVIKLLELAHSGNPRINEIKNLVSQLPAAAAEVRGIQAASHETGPCSCGLDEEVARLLGQLQHWIDHHPDTKKGNRNKGLAMENQRLTKALVEQKKETRRHLTTIRMRDTEIQKLQR